jgi:hypothetical protein
VAVTPGRDVEACRAAAFAACYVAQVERRMDSGLGPPDEEQMERYAEEAKTVADDAARLYAAGCKG